MTKSVCLSFSPRVLQTISDFAPEEFPAVCNTWNRKMESQVRNVIIYSSQEHSRDRLLIQRLKELSTENRLTFIEGRDVEISERGLFSLEELHTDRNTSLNPVIRLLMAMFTEEDDSTAQKQILLELFFDPYFRKTVLQETWKKYDPHKFGLDSHINWRETHSPITEKEEAALAEIRGFFKELEASAKTIPLGKRQKHVNDKISAHVTELAKKYDLKFLRFIAETALVVKTHQITQKLKKTAPFTVEPLFSTLYVEEELDSLRKLNAVHRTYSMATKVISTVEKRAPSMRYSIVLYTGQVHLPILRTRLGSYFNAPITVKEPERMQNITFYHHGDGREVIQRAYGSKNLLTFIGAQNFDIPEHRLYSLEETYRDSRTSLNPVLSLLPELVKVKIYEGLIKTCSCCPCTGTIDHYKERLRIAYQNIVKQLYADPHFRRAIINEKFETYDPHEFGLPKGIAREKMGKDQPSLACYFTQLEPWMTKLKNNERGRALDQSVAGYFEGLEAEKRDLGFLYFLGEFAAVNKTAYIAAELGSSAPLTPRELFAILYEADPEKASRSLFALDRFRTDALVRKVSSVMQKMGKGYSVVICAGERDLTDVEARL